MKALTPVMQTPLKVAALPTSQVEEAADRRRTRGKLGRVTSPRIAPHPPALVPREAQLVPAYPGAPPSATWRLRVASAARGSGGKTEGFRRLPPALRRQRTLKLLLSHAAVGCVIGRGGTLIKEMMLLTGAISGRPRPPSRSPRSPRSPRDLPAGTLIKASQPAELIQARRSPSLSSAAYLPLGLLRPSAAPAAPASRVAWWGRPRMSDGFRSRAPPTPSMRSWRR